MTVAERNLLIDNRRGRRLLEAFRRRTGRHWQPTDSLRRGLILGIGLVAFGALVHRLEAVLVGAPLLIATVVALGRSTGRSQAVPFVRAVPVPKLVEPYGGRSLSVEVGCDPVDELLAVRLPDSRRTGPGRVHVLPAGRYRIRCPVRSTQWGEAVVLRPDHLVTSMDALSIYGPVVGVATRQITLPPIDALPAGPLPPRPAGLVGAHRSRRPGDSTDLRDIRPFAPGDRSRRVDWRVSLRNGFPDAGALHIRERYADADAEVILALDTRVDVGTVVADWSRSEAERARLRRGAAPGSSLDTTIRAASSLAACYLRQGDRVGLIDLGRPQLCLAPGSGTRQLLRLRHRLVVCGQVAGWALRPVLRPHLVPVGAMVIVLSPFLDDGAVRIAVVASRRAGLVVAVDVLPQPLIPDQEVPFGPAALALIKAEHRMRIDALAAHGVPVLSWVDGAVTAAILRRLAVGQRRQVARVAR
jgi:uncharacterized protein (DUF58 family)